MSIRMALWHCGWGISPIGTRRKVQPTPRAQRFKESLYSPLEKVKGWNNLKEPVYSCDSSDVQNTTCKLVQSEVTYDHWRNSIPKCHDVFLSL